jgi:hypothetical protein
MDITSICRKVQLFSGVKSLRKPERNRLTRRSSSSLEAGLGMFTAMVSSRVSYLSNAAWERGVICGSSSSLS